MAALRAAVFPPSAKNRRGGHFLPPPPSSARVKRDTGGGGGLFLRIYYMDRYCLLLTWIFIGSDGEHL